MTGAERLERLRTTVDMAGERDPVHGRERMLWQAINHEIVERERAEELVAALRRELSLYRPEPDAAEPAPKVPGFWLVSVAAHTGLCYARSMLEPYPGGDMPDFEMPAKKTLCGKQTLGPGRFPGYGWPPASMTCAQCRAALPAAGGQLSLLDEAS